MNSIRVNSYQLKMVCYYKQSDRKFEKWFVRMIESLNRKII
jgi:hypothetical protein